MPSFQPAKLCDKTNPNPANARFTPQQAASSAATANVNANRLRFTPKVMPLAIPGNACKKGSGKTNPQPSEGQVHPTASSIICLHHERQRESFRFTPKVMPLAIPGNAPSQLCRRFRTP